LEIPSPVVASAGTSSSGLVPALNTSGVLDTSFGLAAPLAFQGEYSGDLGPSGTNTRAIGTTYTNTTNAAIFVSVTLSFSATGENSAFQVNGVTVSDFTFSAALGSTQQTLYGFASPNDTYELVNSLGAATIVRWLERPISNGLTQGGAVELVSVQNVSGAAEVDFTGFVTGYEYFISGNNVFGNSISLQFGTGSVPTWDNSGGNYAYTLSTHFSGPGSGDFGGQNSIALSPSLSFGPSSLQINIMGAPGAALQQSVTGYCDAYLTNFFGQHYVTEAVSACRIVGSGTISGNFYLYRRSLTNVVAAGSSTPTIVQQYTPPIPNNNNINIQLGANPAVGNTVVAIICTTSGLPSFSPAGTFVVASGISQTGTNFIVYAAYITISGFNPAFPLNNGSGIVYEFTGITRVEAYNPVLLTTSGNVEIPLPRPITSATVLLFATENASTNTPTITNTLPSGTIVDYSGYNQSSGTENIQVCRTPLQVKGNAPALGYTTTGTLPVGSMVVYLEA
jgi:hypothetical protein